MMLPMGTMKGVVFMKEHKTAQCLSGFEVHWQMTYDLVRASRELVRKKCVRANGC